jgi:hypothetical protein
VNRGSRSKLSSLALGTIIAVAMVEFLLRGASITNSDGAIFLFKAPCLPLQIPTHSVEEALRRYHDDPSLVLRYDSTLGWAPRPGGVSSDGLYRYDAVGARAPETPHPEQREGHTISLFGDSTMHGTGVPYGDTIGAYLEENSVTTRSVRNFAVGAYGMDQALLRWRAVHTHSPSHVVVFGFQAENVKRNGSIFRAFYTYESIDIPFSKPRFVLKEESLAPVNLPTIPPQEVVAALKGELNPLLRKHDFFYNPAWYADSVLYHSRFVAFSLAALFMNNRYSVAAREREIYDAQGELGTLAVAIMRVFRDEVEAAGAQFVVVHLPRRFAVSASLEGAELPYSQLLDRVKSEFTVIDPLERLTQVARHDGAHSLYVDPWHYSGRGARVVASAISESIIHSPASL